jgi:SAM-dependent methyltransferase
MPHDEGMLARARAFGTVAEEYERLRPGYPAGLFDDLLDYAGPAADSGVLEVGAGTGKATVPLALRGLRVLALEPSAEMANVLAVRVATAGLAERVRIQVAAFEDMDRARHFGLVVAAQSFHWTDPDTRWRRLADLLIPGGAAGLFWNAWMLDPATHDHRRIRAVFDGEGAGLRPDIVSPTDDDQPLDGMARVSELVDHRIERYSWRWVLATPDYLGLLATTSQYAVLAEDTRARILGALAETLDAEVHLHVVTELTLVRRSV